MRNTGKALLAISALLFTGSLAAADAGASLFEKTHKGAKETKVATDWYAKLPEWVASLTSKNKFPETWLPLDSDFKNSPTPNKFEIRDANKNQFSAYLMVRDGADGNGLPVYKTTKSSKWIGWKSWPAKYILVTYPVETNTDDNDLVAFAAWLFAEKENDLANRVLTVVHGRNKDLAPLIEAYLTEKLGWKDPGALERWALWDMEFQKERAILIPASEKAARQATLEKDAKTDFDAIVRARGDYKGKAPRRVSPTKQLILLEWEIKQYKLTYASSEFLKNAKNADVLAQIMDSITDDKAIIKDNLEKAKALWSDKDIKGQQAKCEMMEEILRIDPMDVALRAETANSWFLYGKPAEHGNGCDRSDPIKKAIPHYLEILKIYPESSGYWLALGRCYQALEDSKRAKPCYDKVIAMEGDKGLGSTAKALQRNMDTKDENRAKSGN